MFHLYFRNTCTCESHYISVTTVNVKIKPLKLLELQHVSVFHKTILRESLVPVKVTYCPLLCLLSNFNRHEWLPEDGIMKKPKHVGVPVILVVYF